MITERFPLTDIDSGDGSVMEWITENGELVLHLDGRHRLSLGQAEAHQLQRVCQPDQERLVTVEGQGDDLVARCGLGRHVRPLEIHFELICIN